MSSGSHTLPTCIMFLFILQGKRIKLPDEWQMKDTENVRVVMLQKTDKVYQDIEQRFLSEVKNGQYKDRVKYSMDPNKVAVTKVREINEQIIAGIHLTVLESDYERMLLFYIHLPMLLSRPVFSIIVFKLHLN